jgi:hypothetical protein
MYYAQEPYVNISVEALTTNYGKTRFNPNVYKARRPLLIVDLRWGKGLFVDIGDVEG